MRFYSVCQNHFGAYIQVRLEAQKCPQIASSENTLILYSQQQTDESDEDDDPILDIQQKIDLDWVHQYLQDFQKLRQDFKCAQQSKCNLDFPPALNGEKWLNFCLGNELVDGNLPSVGLLQSMSDAQIELVIQVIIEYIQDTEQMCNKNIFYWLFSLFIAVQFPMQPSTQSSIRCLLRICVGILKEENQTEDKQQQQQEQQQYKHEQQQQEQQQYQHEQFFDELKIIVVVSGGFFGQSQMLCSLIEFNQS
eukprot:TRINITY_DN3655_c0_g2_i5.p1 TRINITY_DN3655_c0_g2~~TRINITY_DN3655_c0_g2_i5.p1  ORF type:complete len:250 (-),score=21.18 TRINITY_DN3655_c0_g2_i5:235-984(-)